MIDPLQLLGVQAMMRLVMMSSLGRLHVEPSFDLSASFGKPASSQYALRPAGFGDWKYSTAPHLSSWKPGNFCWRPAHPLVRRQLALLPPLLDDEAHLQVGRALRIQHAWLLSCLGLSFAVYYYSGQGFYGRFEAIDEETEDLLMQLQLGCYYFYLERM